VSERRQPVSYTDLITFYAKQLQPDQPLAPRFAATLEREQQALTALQTQHDEALASRGATV
jgi:hypothetical protein